jgi:hypothetical protein
VPGEAEELPAGADQGVALAAVGPEAFDVGVVGPAVELDGHLRVREGDVDRPPPERDTAPPPRETGAAEDGDQPLFGHESARSAAAVSRAPTRAAPYAAMVRQYAW